MLENNGTLDDELPLPSFHEIFGDGLQSNKKKRKHSTSSRIEGSGGGESAG
jgi:hypothetical protein